MSHWSTRCIISQANHDAFAAPAQLGTTNAGKSWPIVAAGDNYLNEASMCDYSLHTVSSRSARAGDNLITTSFPATTTRGFAAVNEPAVAVCLLPGTELAFDNDVEWRQPFFGLFQRRESCGKLARFRQVNTDCPDRHHDALEFPNGKVVLLTDLRSGQKAAVLQLPVTTQVGHDDRAKKGQATVPAIEMEQPRAHQFDDR